MLKYEFSHSFSVIYFYTKSKDFYFQFGLLEKWYAKQSETW